MTAYTPWPLLRRTVKRAPSDVLPAVMREPEVAKLLVVVAEMQHRARNLLTLVGVIAERTARECDAAEFASVFRQRLEAVARAQAFLARTHEGEVVYLDELIAAELAAMGLACIGSDDNRLTLRGPGDVRLHACALEIFALALHELVTNAAKYGALAQPGGRLAISWRWVGRAKDGLLRLDWLETGIVIPSRDGKADGYGRELIERALPFQLGARTEYRLDLDRVHCAIEVPRCQAGVGARRGDA